MRHPNKKNAEEIRKISHILPVWMILTKRSYYFSFKK